MKRKTKKHLIQTVCSILVVVIFFMSHKIGMAKTEFNNITIYYHDEVVTNDTVLTNLYQKIVKKFADKGFPMPNSNYSVYLCKSSTEFKIKSITFSNGVRGKNFQFLDRMYIQEADIANDEVQAASQALNNRTLSGTVAHELTHSYQQEKLGFFKYRTAPNWKLEGMADYVANQSSAKTADALPLFLNGETYSDTINCDKKIWEGVYFYFVSRLRVDYLFTYKKMSEDEFWNTDFDLEKLDSEIRTAIKQGGYIFDNLTPHIMH